MAAVTPTTETSPYASDASSTDTRVSTVGGLNIPDTAIAASMRRLTSSVSPSASASASAIPYQHILSSWQAKKVLIVNERGELHNLLQDESPIATFPQKSLFSTPEEQDCSSHIYAPFFVCMLSGPVHIIKMGFTDKSSGRQFFVPVGSWVAERSPPLFFTVGVMDFLDPRYWVIYAGCITADSKFRVCCCDNPSQGEDVSGRRELWKASRPPVPEYAYTQQLCQNVYELPLPISADEVTALSHIKFSKVLVDQGFAIGTAKGDVHVYPPLGKGSVEQPYVTLLGSAAGTNKPIKGFDMSFPFFN